MTVKELREALKGLDGNMKVYTADHDHSKFETNGIASFAEVVNQKNADDYDKESLNRNPEFKIKGNYFVIHT